jgi:NADH-quinone oxidoreductase subunit G
MTRDAARSSEAGLPEALWNALGLKDGDSVRVQQDDYSVVMPARRDAGLPASVVSVSCSGQVTAGLPNLFGAVSVEKA